MRPQTPAHPGDDRLLELAYGEVPASEARAVRQHVDGCARCRGVLEGIAEVRTAFRSVPAAPAPERGLESLLAYGEQAAARARSRRGGLRLLGLLSAAAALAVVWLVLPAPRQQAESIARAPARSSPERLARADVPAAPVQGDRVRDEERAVLERLAVTPKPAAPPPAEPLRAKNGLAGAAVEPSRHSLETKVKAEAQASGKDSAKPDALAEPLAAAQLRAAPTPIDGLGVRSEPRSGASGALGVGGGVTVTAAAETSASEKKSKATAAIPGELDAAARPRPAAAAPPAPRSPGTADEGRAMKIAAAPLAGVVGTAERAAEPPKPLAKAAPASSGGKAASPATFAEPTARAPQAAKVRVGMGSPEQEARLAEIGRKLATASGAERRALLMERCELEASLQRGPDAVLSCSQVAREFPGTPEAARASEIARGFSVQLPGQDSER